jgi:hypothetical protein
MSNVERQGLRESHKATDGGFGILDAFQGCFEDVMKDFHKAQCEFLNSKPAEAVLPKAEISKDSRGEFIAFAAMDKSKENVPDIGDWLDNRIKLDKRQAA